MKKIYTQFKLYFVAVLLLAFAGKANAEVTADDLVGTYSFTADFAPNNDNELAELLTGNFTFEIIKDNDGYYAVKNFALERQLTYFDFKEGTITFNSAELSYGLLDFADENGSYPYAWPDMFELKWYVDGDGNITIPDFTVVTCDYMNSSATLVAKYTNCVVTKQAEEPKPAVSFAGTYTVTGTKMDYTNGLPPSSSNGSFKLVIGEDGVVTAIAGYEDLSGPIGYGYVIKGTTEGNKFVISVENAALGIGAEYDVLGDVGSAYSGTYDSEGTIEISFKDGAYSITDFSVWQYSWNTTEYTLKYYWSNLDIAKEDGEDPTPEPAVSVAGTYTVTGTKYDYTAGGTPTSAEASFTLSIDEEGNVYEIAGYEVPDVYGAQGVYGKIGENTFTISPVGNSSLSVGQIFDKLGDSNAYEYNDEGTITLSHADGAWTMTDFSVWQAAWEAGGYTYTLKYYWMGLTVTKTSDEVVNGINAINAQPETGAVYNLQGQKVEKAQKGLYIINGKKVVMK